MATFPPLQRPPLASRSLQGYSNPSPAKQLRISLTSKRPRSPDHPEPQTTHKRVRSATVRSTVPTTRDIIKEQRIAEREQKEEEFRRKYSRSFRFWTFYLDIDNIDPSLVQSFKSRLRHLGAVCLFFFFLMLSYQLLSRTSTCFIHLRLLISLPMDLLHPTLLPIKRTINLSL